MLKENSKPRVTNRTFDLRSLFPDQNTSETEYDTHTKPYVSEYESFISTLLVKPIINTTSIN